MVMQVGGAEQPLELGAIAERRPGIRQPGRALLLQPAADRCRRKVAQGMTQQWQEGQLAAARDGRVTRQDLIDQRRPGTLRPQNEDDPVTRCAGAGLEHLAGQGIERISRAGDKGLDIDDDLLVVVPQSDVDNLNPGTYEFIYYVYYDDEVIDMRIRIVHIIENSIQIDIELLPDITTIYVGDTYTDSGAISNIGEVVTHGDVDTDTPGVYPIIYEVTYGTHAVIRTKYVYVVEQTSQDIDEAVIFKKEEVMI